MRYGNCRRGSPRCRGSVMAVVLVVMSVLGLVVAGSVQPLAQEADLAAVRVETTRAFFAAESGVAVVIGMLNAGLEPPEAGTTTAMGRQAFRFIEVPQGGAGGDGGVVGDVVIEGVSGLATRRVLLTIE
jgi:hypothetical protein